MAKESILIVDDEEDIANLLAYNLEKNGYQVSSVYTGEAALEFIQHTKPSLIILDLMLPGMNGLDVCRQLKQDKETEAIPIIMVTAKNEELDEIIGLELGAADYISKPFNIRVLLARVRSCLRHCHEAPKDVLEDQVGDYFLYIDQNRHEVYLGKQLVNLTITEFKILCFLYRSPGRVFSREQIIEALHEDEYVVTIRAVDVQIAGLRKKLGAYGRCIDTVRSVGYRFKEIEEEEV